MLKHPIGISRTLLLFRNIFSGYYRLEQCLADILRYSYAYRFLMRIGTCFKHSVFGRITCIEKQNNAFLLHNSRTVQDLLRPALGLAGRLKNYSKASIIMEYTKAFNKELHLIPFRISGVIVLIALAVNVFFSFLLNGKIGPWGWIIRAIFFFLSMAGIFCDISWGQAKKTSAILKNTY